MPEFHDAWERDDGQWLSGTRMLLATDLSRAERRDISGRLNISPTTEWDRLSRATKIFYGLWFFRSIPVCPTCRVVSSVRIYRPEELKRLYKEMNALRASIAEYAMGYLPERYSLFLSGK